MRESRTYGSGRGACHEMHVPTATPPQGHHPARWRVGGLVALSAAARHIDASLAIVGAQRWPEAGPRKYGNVPWTPSRQAD